MLPTSPPLPELESKIALTLIALVRNGVIVIIARVIKREIARRRKRNKKANVLLPGLTTLALSNQPPGSNFFWLMVSKRI